MTKPLTNLLKKDIRFNWTEEQQKSFDLMRKILTSPKILQYPDFSKPFILTTDASNYAIGAILSQGEIGQDLPIAYASRTLNNAEGNYSTTEKELVAIKWAVQHFRP
ncbi:Retrovirus-related Pol polyprotein from transposon 412 [Eumeta japonica]|uniref:Retrovirus-related Pol polyprotein from transposon 412 n=1 Tax=Eumeta variegata TaxID=151549 RepID=A0A4C1TU25_EUMVA|nr:Retrovirus-related Pol polyprotein from transposon 412 [Eumeta japonica]